MANTTFRLKRSTVSGVTPTTGDISIGELAVNLRDRKLFTSNGSAVFELGSNLTNLAVSGNLTIGSSGDLVFTNGAGIEANGGFGSAGQVLHSNATGVYWATLPGVNTSAQYVWANVQTFNANLVVNSALIANNSAGVVGTVLTSNGSGVYWAPANAGISAVVTQQFTANGTANSFTVTGGYIPNAIEVYVTGVKKIPGTEVIITSGSTINFVTPPLNGQIIDVFGYQSAGSIGNFLAVTGGTLSGNLTFTNGSVIVANGSFGTNGQVLTSNGTSMYWSSAGFTNGQSISVNNFVISGAFTANGANGGAGQVLTSNGSGVYWSSAGVNTAAQYAWTNTHSFAANLTILGTSELIIANGAGIQANGGFGAAGQVLTSNGTGVYWESASAGLSEVVTQQFTANGTANSFLVTGGYFPNAIEVYLAGVKQVPGTDVTLTSGSTVNFTVPPLNGQVVDVFGYRAANNLQSISAIVSQQFTANGTTNTFTITPGYIPNAIEVYVSGVKRIPGTDVDISTGSTITFTTAPLNGQVVDVFGYRSVGAVAPFVDVAGGTMTGNLRFNNTAVIIANGSFGTNGQVLTSNGTSMYWSSAGFTNGQSISVNNFVVNGAFAANGSNGSAGQVLTSNGTGVYWSSAGVNTAAQYSWTNTHTFNANVTFGNRVTLINNTNSTFIQESANATHNVISSTAVTPGAGITEIVCQNSTGAYVYSTTRSSIDTMVSFADYYTSNTANHRGGITLYTEPSRATIDIYQNQLGAGGGFGIFQQANSSTAVINVYFSNTNNTAARSSTAIRNGSITVSNATTISTVNTTGIYLGNTTTNVIITNTVSTFGGNVSITGSANAANVTADVFTGNLTGTASNATNLNSQPGSFYTNATNITTGTLPDARLSSAIVNTSGSFTLGGTFTYNANVTIGATSELIVANGAGIQANGSFGSAGQVLTSNGTGVYWAAAAAGVNTAAQYTWSNTHNFTNVVTFSTANAIILPSGNTASRPAASNGMIRYNTNTQTIEAVANNTWTNMLAAYSSVREQFTATNNQTTFTVTGGYVAGQIDVYYNGVKLRSGSEVNVSSGNTVVLAVGAANGALIEVVGIGPTFVVSNTAQIVYQQFTATNNQTTFTVSNGYVPGQVDVFADGVKLVNGVDVNVSSGSSIVLSTGVPNNTIVEVKGYTTPITSAQSSTAVRQTFTANSTVNNNFTVTGGYIPGQVDVFYNGAKLVNGSDVNTSSGTTIVLTTNAVSGAIVDVVGINYFTAGGGVTTPVRQQLVATANQTSFAVTGGYTPGQIDVFRNGVKLTPGADVDISSGSNVVLVSPAANGDNIDVVGFAATSYQDSVRKSGDTISGSLAISSNLAVTGAATFSNTIAVTGAATFSNTIAVTGTSTLTGNVTTGGVFTDPTGTIRPLVRTVAQTATGPNVDFTGIPSWVRRITVMLNNVSTNGTANLRFRLGTAAGVATSGYTGSTTYSGSSGAGGSFNSVGFDALAEGAPQAERSGAVVFTNLTGNIWTVHGQYGIAGAGITVAFIMHFGGSITLSDTLDRVRVTTVNGTDAFDAGTINILYE